MLAMPGMATTWQDDFEAEGATWCGVSVAQGEIAVATSRVKLVSSAVAMSRRRSMGRKLWRGRSTTLTVAQASASRGKGKAAAALL